VTIVDRTLPADILELASLALTSGLDEVHLMFEGLGADFPAPIGWQLLITRVDPMFELWPENHSSENQSGRPGGVPDYLRVTAQIGSEASAFRQPSQAYWGSEEIAAWLSTPRAGISGPSAEEKAAHERDADRMIAAWRHGWSAERALRRHTKASLEHRAPYETAPMVVSYRYSALNHFYNTEGHPAHRSNGTDISVDIHLSRKDLCGADWLYSAVGSERVPVRDALARVTRRAPWYADVAYFDEDVEEWVR
jgi:hypothetical protein